MHCHKSPYFHGKMHSKLTWKPKGRHGCLEAGAAQALVANQVTPEEWGLGTNPLLQEKGILELWKLLLGRLTHSVPALCGTEGRPE